jgi:hypothetical protein
MCGMKWNDPSPSASDKRMNSTLYLTINLKKYTISLFKIAVYAGIAQIYPPDRV